jgi:serine/threonine protein kinase
MIYPDSTEGGHKPTCQRFDPNYIAPESTNTQELLSQLFTVLAQNTHIKRLELDVARVAEFSAATTVALANMLKLNVTLVSFHHPGSMDEVSVSIGRAVASAPDPIPAVAPASAAVSFDLVLSAKANALKRYLVMDALHVTLLFPESDSLLPLPIRRAFRQGLGLPSPLEEHDSVSSAADSAQADATGMMVASSELPPIDTWVQVGKWQFGVVYRCEFRGEVVCIKTIASNSVDELESVYREFALIQDAVKLAQRRNPHDRTVYEQLRQVAVFPIHFVVPPPDVRDMGSLWLIVPFMERGSLEDVLQKHADLSDDELVELLLDVATALKVCHQFGILHRDISARNILLDGDFRARLCDFGLSCHQSQYWASSIFPFGIWPPEVVVGPRSVFSPSADVWSFGLLIVEVLHRGRQPFLSWRAMCDLFHFIVQNPDQPPLQYKRRIGTNRAPIQTRLPVIPAVTVVADATARVNLNEPYYRGVAQKYLRRYAAAYEDDVPQANVGGALSTVTSSRSDAEQMPTTSGVSSTKYYTAASAAAKQSVPAAEPQPEALVAAGTDHYYFQASSTYLDTESVSRYLQTKQEAQKSGIASTQEVASRYEDYASSETDYQRA